MKNNADYFSIPKISAVYKSSDTLAFRGGFGLGYKLPHCLQKILNQIHTLPQGLADFSRFIKSRKIYRRITDINYKQLSETQFIGINQAFYYTIINNPLVAAKPS